VLDARRDRVHVQSFTVSDDAVTPTNAAAAVPLATVLGTIAPGHRVVVPANLPAAMAAALQAAGAVVQVERAILAPELFAPGLRFVTADFAALEPRYLMASYAEE